VNAADAVPAGASRISPDAFVVAGSDCDEARIAEPGALPLVRKTLTAPPAPRISARTILAAVLRLNTLFN
jgi:hypothetical protein